MLVGDGNTNDLKLCPKNWGMAIEPELSGRFPCVTDPGVHGTRWMPLPPWRLQNPGRGRRHERASPENASSISNATRVGVSCHRVLHASLPSPASWPGLLDTTAQTSSRRPRLRHNDFPMRTSSRPSSSIVRPRHVAVEFLANDFHTFRFTCGRKLGALQMWCPPCR